MSLYQALIDFRDNNNDAMWIRQEDDKDMVSVAAANSNNRGKSWLMIKFNDAEDYIGILTNENDYTNNSFYISVAFGRGYYSDSVFVDAYYEAESSWDGGFIFNYFDEENKQLFNEIIKLVNPMFDNYHNMPYPKQEEVGKFFYTNYEDEASDIGYEYATEYDSALVTGLREHLESGFCDVLKDFKVVRKICAKQYLTTVDNLLNLWDESGASSEDNILEMLKQFISEKSLQIDEDLAEDYYVYYDDKNFDLYSFNRSTNIILNKLHDKIIEGYNPEDVKENEKIVKLIIKYNLGYGEWNNFPKEKNFGKIKKDSHLSKFKINKIDGGMVNIMLYNPLGQSPVGWMDYEEFSNFLLHPKLFD